MSRKMKSSVVKLTQAGAIGLGPMCIDMADPSCDKLLETLYMEVVSEKRPDRLFPTIESDDHWPEIQTEVPAI